MRIRIQKRKRTKQIEERVFYTAATKLLANEELEIMQTLILDLLPSSPKNQQIESRIINERCYSFCFSRFPNSLSLKLLRVYALSKPRSEETVREIAIRRLDALLSGHRGRGEPLLESCTLQELAPLLVSCLEEEGVPEDTFKILAHVAFEIFRHNNSGWSSLRRFISSRARTEFKKAVYMLLSLSSPLDAGEFVIPLMENLLPQVLKWLEPSKIHRENNWVSAFSGAFCAAIHLLRTIRVDLVINIAYKMLGSVSELVNRGMEVGFVRRAFRDVEMLVKKQSDWYRTEEYKFVSGLIQRMNAVKGMKNGTKAVLWRIQMGMEKYMTRSVKKRDKGVEDWLNQY